MTAVRAERRFFPRTLDEARGASRLADSFSRLQIIVNAEVLLPPLDWYTLLGQEWSGCDNIRSARPFLSRKLREASREELDAMMDPDERAALARLPTNFAVYRGCYEINRKGLSWTIEWATAARFPYLMRYWRPKESPLLITGTVLRDRTVLKLDRNEQEIISAQVKVTNVEQLTPSSPRAQEALP